MIKSCIEDPEILSLFMDVIIPLDNVLGHLINWRKCLSSLIQSSLVLILTISYLD